MIKIKCSIIDDCIIRVSKDDTLYFEVLIGNTIVSIYKSDEYESPRLVRLVTCSDRALANSTLKYNFDLVSNLSSMDCLLKDAIMHEDLNNVLFFRVIAILRERALI